MNKRSLWVDYAKAIGIILIVYGHVARGVFDAGMNFNKDTYILFDSIVYSFHVPLFFFLSGLFFYKSLSKYGTYGLLASKVDTIIYPYIIWSIIQGVIEVIMSSYTNGNAEYSEVLSLLWSPRAQFWFLYALFMIFIAVSILFRKIPIRFVLIVFLLTAFLYIFQAETTYKYNFNYIADNLVFFVLGIVFKRYSSVEKYCSEKFLPLFIILFTGSQYIYHSIFNLTFENKGIFSLLLALISIAFVISISKFLVKRQVHILLTVGASTMAILVMHILAASGSRVIIKSILGITSVPIHLLFGCIIGVTAPIVAMAIIKRFKIPFVFSMPISSFVQRVYIWGSSLKR